jgi:hypothetical protein
MLRNISSFFPAVSKDLHVTLLNVENVRDKEKMKSLAAAKEVAENLKRTKILENYDRNNQLRKQRRLKDRQNAIEIDPETVAIDDITFDMIAEEPRAQQVKRKQYARPKNWETIAEYYGQWGKNSTIRAFPNEFSDRTSRSIDQAMY